jgi:hypothetical protein
VLILLLRTVLLLASPDTAREVIRPPRAPPQPTVEPNGYCALLLATHGGQQMSDSKADDCAEQKEEAKPDYLANIKRGPALHERKSA